MSIHGKGSGNRTGNCHDGANRQIDASGRDDQCHADAQKGGRRATIEHVNQIAEEAPVLEFYPEEIREYHEVQHQNGSQDDQLRGDPPEGVVNMCGHQTASAMGSSAMAATMLEVVMSSPASSHT